MLFHVLHLVFTLCNGRVGQIDIMFWNRVFFDAVLGNCHKV